MATGILKSQQDRSEYKIYGASQGRLPAVSTNLGPTISKWGPVGGAVVGYYSVLTDLWQALLREASPSSLLLTFWRDWKAFLFTYGILFFIIYGYISPLLQVDQGITHGFLPPHLILTTNPWGRLGEEVTADPNSPIKFHRFQSWSPRSLTNTLTNTRTMLFLATTTLALRICKMFLNVFMILF